jgi:hypothetical protein
MQEAAPIGRDTFRFVFLEPARPLNLAVLVRRLKSRVSVPDSGTDRLNNPPSGGMSNAVEPFT